MLTININKLRGEVEAREQRKIKIYEKILELCYQRILNSNQKSDEYSCTYIVPNVVFGLPLYDVNDCVRYIMNKLIEKEFDISFAYPTTIHISWRPDDKYNKTNNSNNNSNSNKQLSITQKQYKNENRGIITHSNSNKSHNTQIQSKNFKPIDEYSHSKSLIYDPDDINLFQSKLDNLFN